METKTVLFGASGHGKVVLDTLVQIGHSVDVICDDHPKVALMHGVPVVTPDKVDFTNAALIFSIGNNKVRHLLAQKYSGPFLQAIHPNAIISSTVTLGEGTVVMAGAIINTDSSIGNHVIVNTGAMVDHECHLDDFVHISPGVALAGNVCVGEGTHVGIGACVIQGIKIGKWCTIGAGAVILKDVPDYAVVVGNPGKIIKYNEPHV